ncbi:hypothetical protein NC653_019828 [Populus alba x Populus x berolinensis]|uniref:Uncharacterized protein n=1 Tax=Populus alba x Populus x berolinensis TaxID=444605 RepID=A0AAD6MKM0_9ROSI|nr:hypothetical protein NC653_019828 [Populus alba x Populus x berolinensis]
MAFVLLYDQEMKGLKMKSKDPQRNKRCGRGGSDDERNTRSRNSSNCNRSLGGVGGAYGPRNLVGVREWLPLSRQKVSELGVSDEGKFDPSVNAQGLLSVLYNLSELYPCKKTGKSVDNVRLINPKKIRIDLISPGAEDEFPSNGESLQGGFHQIFVTTCNKLTAILVTLFITEQPNGHPSFVSKGAISCGAQLNEDTDCSRTNDEPEHEINSLDSCWTKESLMALISGKYMIVYTIWMLQIEPTIYG